MQYIKKHYNDDQTPQAVLDSQVQHYFLNSKFLYCISSITLLFGSAPYHIAVWITYTIDDECSTRSTMVVTIVCRQR